MFSSGESHQLTENELVEKIKFFIVFRLLHYNICDECSNVAVPQSTSHSTIVWLLTDTGNQMKDFHGLLSFRSTFSLIAWLQCLELTTWRSPSGRSLSALFSLLAPPLFWTLASFSFCSKNLRKEGLAGCIVSSLPAGQTTTTYYVTAAGAGTCFMINL